MTSLPELNNELISSVVSRQNRCEAAGTHTPELSIKMAKLSRIDSKFVTGPVRSIFTPI